MRGVYSIGHISELESRAIAAADGTGLMRRAAFAVAVCAARMLREHGGCVAGKRVALLVGAGDNGGDALFAGAFLRRRGVAVTAVLLAPDRAHPEGLAALKSAGGRLGGEPELR
ncbi:MAG: NAD(P)H-hydrate epimerase, partial [Sciscionella sp.]